MFYEQIFQWDDYVTEYDAGDFIFNGDVNFFA